MTHSEGLGNPFDEKDIPLVETEYAKVLPECD
jgi:hypothetical protein